MTKIVPQFYEVIIAMSLVKKFDEIFFVELISFSLKTKNKICLKKLPINTYEIIYMTISAIYFFVSEKVLNFLSILFLMRVNTFDQLKIIPQEFTLKQHERSSSEKLCSIKLSCSKYGICEFLIKLYK